MGVGSLVKDGNTLVKFAFILGLGLIILGKFQSVSGITTAANTAVGSAITAIDDYIEWFGIIVIVAVGAYLYKQMNTGMGN